MTIYAFWVCLRVRPPLSPCPSQYNPSTTPKAIASRVRSSAPSIHPGKGLDQRPRGTHGNRDNCGRFSSHWSIVGITSVFWCWVECFGGVTGGPHHTHGAGVDTGNYTGAAEIQQRPGRIYPTIAVGQLCVPLSRYSALWIKSITPEHP